MSYWGVGVGVGCGADFFFPLPLCGTCMERGYVGNKERGAGTFMIDLVRIWESGRGSRVSASRIVESFPEGSQYVNLQHVPQIRVACLCEEDPRLDESFLNSPMMIRLECFGG